MKKNKTRYFQVVPSVFLCILVVSLVGALFSVYNVRLNGEFDKMVRDNLSAYAQSQRIEVQADIKDVQGTLEAVATLIESSGLDPSGEWLALYLNDLSLRQERYNVGYFSLDKLLSAYAGKDEGRIYERLQKGETVITQVKYSSRLNGGYYFGIVVPVYQDGQVVGALRSLLKAELLVHTSQTGYQRASIRSCLVDSEGNFITVSPYQDERLTGNLLEKFAQMPGNEQSVEQIKDALANGQSAVADVYVVNFDELFVSVMGLGYNGWHVVSFAEAEEISQYSAAILKHTVWIGLCLVVLTLAAGGMLFFLLYYQRRQLNLEQRRYAVLANFSDTVLFEYSYEKDTMIFTTNARKLFPIQELTIPSYLKSYLAQSPFLHPDDREALKEHILDRTLPEGEQRSFELRLGNGEGEYFWCLCQYQMVYEKKKALPTLLFGKLSDINEQKEKEEGLLARSEIDALTGVYNKAAIEAKIREYLRRENAKGVLLMVDFDDFKLVNDLYGHKVGDDTLKAVGRLMRASFRERDLLGRAGGDEFMVFLPDTADFEVAVRRTNGLLHGVRSLSIADGPQHLSCSIGGAVYPKDADSYEKLYELADQALYQAKRAGKNTISFI